MKNIQVSKKLFVALLVLAIELLRGYGYELPPESYTMIMMVSMTYLGGQSLVDSVLAYKGIKKQ